MSCMYFHGLLIVPVFMILIWYPQKRMLGSDARISTTAAITAEIEMKQGSLKIDETAKCPECDARSNYRVKLMVKYHHVNRRV